jgi:UDP-N-acetylmuramate: L-alanyl-gamma-D-glutamyl-meso-diaminopimelate ligase
VFNGSAKAGTAEWPLLGQHNLENALAALLAARSVGVAPQIALQALAKFKGVKRRLEKLGVFGGITVYEDFAHHPTAIAATLNALHAQRSDERIIAVLEPRSNTMRMGVHRDALIQAFDHAHRVFVLGSAQLDWNPQTTLAALGRKLDVAANVDELVASLLDELRTGDRVLLMSNGSFQGLPLLLRQALEDRELHSVAAPAARS